jgi:Holliday junction resolvase-like predicted endonuclease
MPPLPDWIAWFAIALVVVLTVAWYLAKTKIRRHNQRRQRKAIAGEYEAEKLLERNGYRIVDRQVDRRWLLWVDGEPRDVRSRADLLVNRRGLDFVAEVKTGKRAPDPTLPATRRQLMEYLWVFPVAGVLLVDVAEGCIHEVHWQGPDTR